MPDIKHCGDQGMVHDRHYWTEQVDYGKRVAMAHHNCPGTSLADAREWNTPEDDEEPIDLDACICDDPAKFGARPDPLRVYPGPDGKRHGMRCPVVNRREEEEETWHPKISEPEPPSLERKLASTIWEASRDDEGSISGIGADWIAGRILSKFHVCELVEETSKPAWQPMGEGIEIFVEPSRVEWGEKVEKFVDARPDSKVPEGAAPKISREPDRSPGHFMPMLAPIKGSVRRMRRAYGDLACKLFGHEWRHFQSIPQRDERALAVFHRGVRCHYCFAMQTESQHRSVILTRLAGKYGQVGPFEVVEDRVRERVLRDSARLAGRIADARRAAEKG